MKTYTPEQRQAALEKYVRLRYERFCNLPRPSDEEVKREVKLISKFGSQAVIIAIDLLCELEELQAAVRSAPDGGNSRLTQDDMRKLRLAAHWCDKYVSHRTGEESLPTLEEAEQASTWITEVLRSAGPTSPVSVELPERDATFLALSEGLGDDDGDAEVLVRLELDMRERQLRALTQRVAELERASKDEVKS